MDFEAIRVLIRTKLADGRLPVNGIPRVWGGPGKDEICVACESSVMKDEFIIEGICLTGGVEPLRLHAKCFWLWKSERRHVGVN
jgi:hypothetical protein